MTVRFVAAILVALSLSWAALAEAGSVAIGAGAGYKRMLVELNTAFTERTGVAVEQTYGHMGHIAAQAMESGRMDIIFGDRAFLESVRGLGIERCLDVGKGRLVVAWASGVPMKTPADLAGPAVERIAIPDTRNAIFGKAGMEFLTRSGMLDAVRPKLVEVSTVPQVTAYLASGEVQAGLVNLTDAMGVRDRIGGYAEVDQSLYEPIRIVGAVLSGASSKPETARYLEFLETPAARAILEKYGL